MFPLDPGVKQFVLGDRQTVKVSAQSSKNSCQIIEQNDPPGVGIPLHVHLNEDETFYVISGEVEVQVGDYKYLAKAEDSVFCPRGVPHAWKVVGTETAKCLLIVSPGNLDEMFMRLEKVDSEDFTRIVNIASEYDIKFI